ncbi:MAG TPA: ChaN family lipoprotein [Flavobacteriaceae bacterium]|nr:ChaN family lipoprotein [Flavobacteriaceae bacterium]
MKKLFASFLLFCSITLNAQELKSYQIYNQSEKKVSFGEMIDALSKYDVVLFGEFHDVSIIHWLELKTAEALYRKKEENLVLGAEMFERDNQIGIDQYLNAEIEAEQLQDSVRLWKNYETDYRPILDFAKAKNLKFIATNIPLRYAKLVAYNGLDTLMNLPQIEKTYIAKLPIEVDMETPGYLEMKKLMEAHAGPNLMNFISAQAIKDATMAESILNNQKGKQLFLHFNGNYHSKEYGGIYWWLKKQKGWLENLKVAVISVAKSEDSDLAFPNEEKTIVDYTIVVPSDMTKTY